MFRNKANDSAERNASERRAKESKDLLRAYEHLTRIDILEGSLAGPEFCDVSTLVALALSELAGGRDREAADLLRSAEHISFAAQSPDGYAASAIRVFEEVRSSIDAEFDILVRRADLFREQPSFPRHGAMPELCARTLQNARQAYAEQAFSRALELARAAELLAGLAACGSRHSELERRIAS